MQGRKYILALDVGTTAIKAVAFEPESMAKLGSATVPIEKTVSNTTVEQDPVMLIEESIHSIKNLIESHNLKAEDCLGLGITNQRETSILWDKKTGEPVYPAIVWEDKRTQSWCNTQNRDMHKQVEQKTGLSLTPYFSASKIVWILNHVESVREKARAGDILFGTVDSWLLWNLSAERSHATDWTNASRTLLFDVQKQSWSQELCDAFQIPMSILPKVQPSASVYGHLRSDVFGHEIPILALCGDQQSSMFAAEQYCGQEIGCTKITFGTGLFLMQIARDRKQVEPPFYPSLCLTPDAQDLCWAVEYKIERIGAEVQTRLHDPRELDRYLDRLTSDVAIIISQLPIKPDEIIIDGGVTQNPHLRAFLQEKIQSSRIIQLSTHNGTALGVALLVKVGG